MLQTAVVLERLLLVGEPIYPKRKINNYIQLCPTRTSVGLDGRTVSTIQEEGNLVGSLAKLLASSWMGPALSWDPWGSGQPLVRHSGCVSTISTWFICAAGC